MPRRFRRRPAVLLWVSLGLAALILCRFTYDLFVSAPQSTVGAIAPGMSAGGLLVEGPCEVLKVRDDGLLVVRQTRTTSRGVENHSAVARLLAVEMPREKMLAVQFIREQLAPGEVTLGLDKRRLDPADNLWVYIYVQRQLLNEELLRAGLARWQPYPADSSPLAKRLQQAQAEARREGRGIWAINAPLE